MFHIAPRPYIATFFAQSFCCWNKNKIQIFSYFFQDNCPYHSNRRQHDRDLDTVGNKCDNCINIKNTDQLDTDDDGLGDVCDDDIDNDGIMNRYDNCVIKANTDQRDKDRDGVGDVCDNCPDNYNPKQVSKLLSNTSIEQAVLLRTKLSIRANGAEHTKPEISYVIILSKSPYKQYFQSFSYKYYSQ